jgi:hypothetical protein
MTTSEDTRHGDQVGIVFVSEHAVSWQRRPFVVTAMRPLDVIACEALPAAGRLLGVRQNGADVAREGAAAALAHSDSLSK